MNLFLLTSIIFLFFAQMVQVFKSASAFTDWEPLTFLVLDVSIKETIFRRKLLIKNSDFENYVKFIEPKEGNFVPFSFCIYKNDSDYENEVTEFENCFQKENVTAPSIINIKKTPTDDYYLLIKNQQTSFDDEEVFFFSRWSDNEIMKDGTKYLINFGTHSSKECILIEASPRENLTLIISKTVLNNTLIVRIFDIAEGTRTISNTTHPFYAHISNEGSAAKKYLVEISTETNNFLEVHYGYGFITKDNFFPVVEENLFSFDIDNRKTFYFKYGFQSWNVLQDSIIVLGIKSNKTSYDGEIKCYVGCFSEEEDEDFAELLNKGSDNCLPYFMGDNSTFKYYIGFKKNLDCEYPNKTYLLFSHEIIPKKPNQNDKYLIYCIEPEEKISTEFDSLHLKYSKTPFVDSLLYFRFESFDVYELLEEKFLFYLENSDFFLSSLVPSASLVESFRGDLMTRGNVAGYFGKGFTIFVILYNNEDKVKRLDLYLKPIEEKIQTIKIENNQFAVPYDHLSVDFRDSITSENYYIFSAKEYENAHFYFSQYYGNCSVYYKKITLTKEGDFDYIPTEEDKLNQDTTVIFEPNRLVKTVCDIPTDIAYFLFGSGEVEPLPSGERNVYLKGFSEKKLVSNFEYFPSYSAISVGNSKDVVKVSNSTGNYEIKPNSYMVFPFNNCSDCYLTAKSSEDIGIKFISIPSSDYFYDLNKELEWNKEQEWTIEKDMGYRIMYLINETNTWNYLEISIKKNKSQAYDYIFGYIDIPSQMDKFTGAFPYYQKTKSKEKTIRIKNPKLFDNFNAKDKTFYLQIYADFKITKLTLQYQFDALIYGENLTEGKIERIPLKNSVQEYVISDGVTLGKNNNIISTIRFCGKKENKTIKINSIYNNDIRKTFTLGSENILEYFSTKSILQLRVETKSTDSEKSTEGIEFGYLSTPTVAEENFLKKYYSHSGGQIYFDANLKKVYWDKIDDKFNYEIYLVASGLSYGSGSPKDDLVNDCFLGYIRSNVKEHFENFWRTEEKNYFMLKENMTGEIGINIVATPEKDNIPLRILYNPIFITVNKEIVFTEYPILEKTLINSTYNLVYIKLKQDEWDYFEITIHEELSFSVYLSFEKGELSPPVKDSANLIDNEIGGAFAFKNPGKSNESYYVCLRFTEDKVYGSIDYRGYISYKYVNKTFITKDTEVDELGVISLRNTEEILNTNYRIFQNISINKANKLTLLLKICNSLDNIDYLLNSSTVLLTDDLSSPADITTYSDMFLSFSSEDELEETVSGIQISYGKDLTEKMKEDLSKIVYSGRMNFKYDKKKRVFSLRQIPLSEKVYEKQIYIMPNNDKVQYDMESDCYLKHLEETKPEGFVYKVTKGNSVAFNAEPGDYVAAMVAAYKYPIPLRIQGEVISFNIDLFEKFKDYPTKQTEEIGLTSKYLLIILPRNKWKYFEVSLEDTNFEYYNAFEYEKNEEDIKTIEETEEAKVTKKNNVLVFSNPYNEATRKGVFYFQIKMTSQPLAPSSSLTKLTDLSFEYFNHTAKYLRYDKYGISYSIKAENDEFYMRISKEITVNVKNKVFFISKNCYEKDRGKTLVFTGGKSPIHTSTLGPLKLDSFETYSDVYVQLKNAESISYNGFWIGTGLDLSEEQIQKAQQIIKKEPGKITFDNKTFVYSWDPVDEVNYYEVYIFKKTAKAIENDGNDCFLLEKRSAAAGDEDLVFYQTTNETSIVFEEKGDFIISVVAIFIEPISCRLNLKTLHNSITDDYIPSQKHEEIPIEHKNISFMIPHTTQWNYVEIKISNIQFSYYYIFDKQTIEYRKDNTFVFYSRHPDISPEKNSKYSFRFSNTALENPPKKNGDTQYRVYYEPDVPVKKYENFYFNSLGSLPSLLSDDLNAFTSNKITLAIKACTKPLKLSISKYLEETIDENYKIFDIEPLSLITIGTKQLEEISKYNGFLLSYNLSISDSDRAEAQKFLHSKENLTVPKFNNVSKSISWNSIEGLQYSIYFLKERNFECAESDCCLMEKALSNIVQIKKPKKNYMYSFSSYEGAGIAVVVGVSKGKLPLRVLYPPIEILIPYKYDSLVSEKKYKIKGQSYSYALYSYEENAENYDYLQVKISGITKGYKVMFGLYEDNSYELPNKKTRNKDFTFVFANPYKNKRGSTEKYYFSLLFVETENSSQKKESLLLSESKNEEESYSFNIQVQYEEKSEIKESDLKKREDNTGYYIFKDSPSAYFEVSDKITQNKENEVFLIAKKCSFDGDDKLKMKVASGLEENIILETELTKSYKVYEFSTFTEFSGIISGGSNTNLLLNYAIDLDEAQQTKLNQILSIKEQDIPKAKGLKLSWKKVEGFSEMKFELYIMKSNENNKKYGGDECYLMKSDQIIEVLKTSENSTNLEVKENDFIVTVVGIIEEPMPIKIIYPPLQIKKNSSPSSILLYILVFLLAVVVVVFAVFLIVWRKKKVNSSEIEKEIGINKTDEVSLLDSYL